MKIEMKMLNKNKKKILSNNKRKKFQSII